MYESIKPGPGGSVSLILTPMELLDRLAALIPPPRRHRHRYFGVLAPNSPQREAVTALAAVEVETVAATPKATDGETRVCQAARHAYAGAEASCLGGLAMDATDQAPVPIANRVALPEFDD